MVPKAPSLFGDSVLLYETAHVTVSPNPNHDLNPDPKPNPN